MPQQKEHHSQETTNAVNEAHFEELEKEIKALKDQVKKLLDSQDRALRWGVVTLGSIVIALVTGIFNFISGHLK